QGSTWRWSTWRWSTSNGRRLHCCTVVLTNPSPAADPDLRIRTVVVRRSPSRSCRLACPTRGRSTAPADPIDWARPPAVVADPGSRTAPPVSFALLGDPGAGHCGRWLVRVGWVVRAGGARVSGQYPAEVRGPRRARRAVR